jgi:hypothetical protein
MVVGTNNNRPQPQRDYHSDFAYFDACASPDGDAIFICSGNNAEIGRRVTYHNCPVAIAGSHSVLPHIQEGV